MHVVCRPGRRTFSRAVGTQLAAALVVGSRRTEHFTGNRHDHAVNYGCWLGTPIVISTLYVTAYHGIGAPEQTTSIRPHIQRNFRFQKVHYYNVGVVFLVNVS